MENYRGLSGSELKEIEERIRLSIFGGGSNELIEIDERRKLSILGWSSSELRELEERIRLSVIGSRGATLDEYIKAAESKSVKDIGYLELWILKNEPLIWRCFPDRVKGILFDKIGTFLRFAGKPDKILIENAQRGVEWLAARLYVKESAVCDRARYIGLKLPKKRHFYKEEEREFIRENAQMGAKFLAEKIRVTPKSIYHIASKMHVSIPRHNFKAYSAEEMRIVKNANLEESDEQIAGRLYEKTGERRNAVSVSKKRRGLGNLRRETFHWDEYPEAFKYIHRNHLRMRYARIREKLNSRYNLGLTYIQVAKKAWNSGLKRRSATIPEAKIKV